MTNEIIALMANLALALSFIVGLVFGIAQVKAAARDRKERLTLQTLQNFQTREFAELIFQINSYNIPPTLEEWRKLSAVDHKLLEQTRISNFRYAPGTSGPFSQRVFSMACRAAQ